MRQVPEARPHFHVRQIVEMTGPSKPTGSHRPKLQRAGPYRSITRTRTIPVPESNSSSALPRMVPGRASAERMA